MYKMKIIETKGEYDRWKLERGKGGERYGCAIRQRKGRSGDGTLGGDRRIFVDFDHA